MGDGTLGRWMGGMPDGISIAAAASDRVDDLLELTRACIDHMRRHGVDQWDELYPSRATIESDVRNGTTFAAYCGPNIVGAIVLNDYADPQYAEVAWKFTTGRAAVVHRLMVAPEMEGRGLARALMRFSEERARCLGFQCIRLDAFTKNLRALRLYGTLGFRDAGVVQFRKGLFRCFEKSLG